ncbi:50S ribosomal protein L9 [Acaryochloris sp. 'Moss Beach']|uniref:50S ribosomal protein L9 n=1 Tax=Acaryochloris sp. 'Moss Beach' TaxID=2740837 RepID=UPI001F4254F7|nr:50S ribosomal protein L9 [Acaryochloris sp. 'Moss Beach']UJB69175.1 50S ribosomal protein L9 [Acaryochloris sp. 'Moss Beach']
MGKRVQLVLNEDVRKLGYSGDLVEVAPGFARNYLIPKGIAYRATPGVLKQIEYRKAEELKRLEGIKDEAAKQKVALQTIGTFRIEQKAGEEEMLFGRVTSPDVAELIANVSGFEIDKRGIDIPDIRKLGTYSVDIKLHPEIIATVKVEVVPL